MTTTSLDFGIQSSRLLNATSKAIQKSLERLSSGKRINEAKDDLAGFAAAIKLDSDIRGLAQANSNINQAVGIVQTADAAISVQVDLVQRIREIAVQGSSGLLTSSDRSSLNNEVLSLMDEFRRITNNTEFGDFSLLDGTFGTEEIQIGADKGDEYDLELAGTQDSETFVKNASDSYFSSFDNFDVGDSPTDLIFNDFNNDGNLDIATVNGGADNQIAVRLGNNDGTFKAAVTSNLSGSSQVEMTAGDVNNDGIQDLVVIDNATTEFAEVLIGNGDGTFRSGDTFEITEASNAQVALADFNNDGSLDVVTGSGANFVSILLNNGDGTFQGETTIALVNSTGDADQIKVGDFDNDGAQDILVTDTATGTSEILFSDNNGSFTLQGSGAVLGGTAANTVVGDFDNDGNLDVIQSEGSSTTVEFFTTDGGRTSASPTAAFSASSAVLEMQAADFNNDGYLDIVGRTASSIEIWLNDGDGTFTQDFVQTGAGSNGLAAGDLSGDGIADVAQAASASDVAAIGIMGVTEVSAVADVSVLTQQSSIDLVKIADRALAKLNEERTSLSSSLSVFSSIQESNLLTFEQFSSAKEDLEAADFAVETTELVSNQILQQSQIAAMSQSQLNAQTALSLLNNL